MICFNYLTSSVERKDKKGLIKMTTTTTTITNTNKRKRELNNGPRIQKEKETVYQNDSSLLP